MANPMELALTVIGAICNPTRFSIVEHVQKERKATFTELKNLTGLQGTSLQFHLRTLMDVGILKRTTERGPYMVTNIGLEGLKTVKIMEKAMEAMK